MRWFLSRRSEEPDQPEPEPDPHQVYPNLPEDMAELLLRCDQVDPLNQLPSK